MMLPQRPLPGRHLEGGHCVSGRSKRIQSGTGRRNLGRGGVAEAGAETRRRRALEPDASLGEQQRLGIARALLHKPQYPFLDEATASLDEPSEMALYRLLQERLPATAIVSIGNRSTLEAFHQRRVLRSRVTETDLRYGTPAMA